MGKEELLEGLQSLLLLIQKEKRTDAILSEKTVLLKMALKQSPARLLDFDHKHKDRYIHAKIGGSPQKPYGAIKLVVPVYLAKKNKYEKAYDEYQKKGQLQSNLIT